MTTHIKGLSYAPKIPAVLAGTCRQTIRKIKEGQYIQPGDKIIFICISGRMHRWKSWRKEVEVSVVHNIRIVEEGIIFEDGVLRAWSTVPIYSLAKEDGIEPATGEALRDVLFKYNGVPGKDGTRCQVIRW